MNSSFGLDWNAFWIALFLLATFYFLYKKFLSVPTPHIKFSSLSLFAEGDTSNPKKRIYSIPAFLRYGALAFFFLAFLDPHFFIPLPPSGRQPLKEPLEGIAIYLILDQSGSMEEKVEALLPDGSRGTISKIDLLKETTKSFVESRPNDMIGLIGFARGAQVLDPLTLDHQAILKQLTNLGIQTTKGQEGTSIGYAVYKTANLIAATRHYAQELIKEGAPAYTIKNSIMILVTDGVPEPNPLDAGKRLRNMTLPEAAEYAKRTGIRLYVVNIDPGFTRAEYEPFRKQMKQSTELTGGRFFMIGDGGSLSRIYQDIDALEKSKLPGEAELVQLLQKKLNKDQLPGLYRRFSLYPYLIALGLLSLLLSIFFETTLLRKVP